MPPHPPSRRAGTARGFSLVEVLTVITVLAMLAAILVPAIGLARTRAMKAKTVSLFSQITNAMDLYYADNGKFPVFPGMADNPNPNSAGDLSFYVNGGDSKTSIFWKTLSYDTSNRATAANNPRQAIYLNVEDNMLSTDDPLNPALVDGFGNKQIAIVVNTNGKNRIDKNSFTLSVLQPDGTGKPLIPLVNRDLPQHIAIYSLFHNQDDDPVASTFNTNWQYDDYSK